MSSKNIISAEEVRFLHEFCKKKDIQYLDLRIELVDHLAELVLEVQENHPNLNFKEAFYRVYKSYGIFGFLEVAEQHEKQMQKRYWREIWQTIKKWITLPRIFVTGLLSTGVYQLALHLEKMRLPLYIVSILVFVVFSVLTVVQFRKNKKVLNGERSVLMSGSNTSFTFFGYMLFQMSTQGALHGNDYNFSQLNPVFLTVIFMSVLLFGWANYLLQLKAETQLQELKTYQLAGEVK